jgi:hypothetical protein
MDTDVQLQNDRFDHNRLQSLIDDLQNTGLAVQPRWLKGKADSTPEQANNLILNLGEQQVFHQVQHMAKLHPESLSESQQKKLFAALQRQGMLKEPDYGLGVLCLVVYAALQFIILPRVAQIAPGLLVALIIGYVLLLAGHVLFSIRARADKQVPLWLPLTLMAPAILATAPSSLLNLPLLNQYNCARLYNRAAQLLGEPAAMPLSGPQSDSDR